jgi:hypothetical protein
MVSVAMKRNLPVLLALATAGLWSGCGSAQINRIDKYRDIYEQWPIEVKQAVLDGKVEPGMTQDMVVVSWGQPTEKVNRSNATNDEEIWIYRKGGDDGTMMVPAGGIMGGPSYPSGGYPSGGVYPGGIYGGGMGTGSGIGISTGRGGTGITTGTGIGMGGNIGGMGTTPVIMTRPTPAEEREVVFRNGVVYRADAP